MTTITKRLIVLQLLVFVSCVSTVSAFDGKRSGFCLGFGFGAESITSFEDFVPIHHNRTGFQTTLDIGAGITDQILLIYSGHTTVNTTEDPPYDRVIWMEPTIVLRYYFKPELRSWYIFGGPAMAIGTGFARYEEVFGTGGFGVTAGAGYQFGGPLQFQIGGVFAGQSDIRFLSVHFTMNVVGF